MCFYYTVLKSKSHAFMLDNRLRTQQIGSELAYIPRELINDMCSMGVRFKEADLSAAVEAIKNLGLPGVRVYKEVMQPGGCQYIEVQI